MHGARDDGEQEGNRIGVLLVNLGTPDAPTPAAIRRYLAEFLSDPRIVDLPRIFWLPLLHGIILPLRSGATTRKYKKIWRDDGDSPLRYFTRAQSEAVANIIGDETFIDWAMRYGNPSILDRMRAQKEKGCTRIFIIPLYPQYSATTTASVEDAVQNAVSDLDWRPQIRTINAFYQEPAYIDALAAVTRRKLSELNWKPERVVISFHGLPQRYVDAGDPYLAHCTKTAALLREAMGWADDFAPITFQSKFGRAKWLEPATTVKLKTLAEQGIKNLAVIMPSFVSDCIESLEEIDITAREIFLMAGGETFETIPCLNHTPGMVSLLASLIHRERASGFYTV